MIPTRLQVRPSEAARLLSVSPRRIGQLVAEGELDFVVIGKRRLIPLDAVHDLVERRRQRVTVRPDEVRERVREIAAARRRRQADTDP